METFTTIIIPVVTAIGGLGLGGVGTWIILLYKEKRTQDIAANDQAVKIYKEVLEGVRNNFDKLDLAYNTLHNNYLDTKIELAKVQVLLSQVKEHIVGDTPSEPRKL